jgi:hypothetical protein
MNYKAVIIVFFIVFFSVTSYAQTTEPKSLKILDSREIKLKGCIQTHFNKEFIIKNNTEFLNAIRNDASRKFCTENLEKLDFTKNNLVGIEINSGYCRRPIGLEAVVTDDIENKQFIIEISYAKPVGLCRALSQYDLWLMIPKIPDNYKVGFKFPTNNPQI